MGVYKEAEYFGNDAFFEQLFKHEGYCLWNDEDLYEFMSDTREEAWPEGCVETGYSLSGSDGYTYYLYLDLKPTYNGNMSYGLYMDEYCKYEYKGSKVRVDDVAKTMGLLYGSYLNKWNEALEVYKVCQPCMAYNLQVTSPSSSSSNNYYDNYEGYNENVASYGNYGYGNNIGNQGDNGQYYDSNNNNDNQWWKWWGGGNRRRLGEDDDGYTYDVNEGYFRCDDIADWTNVNQVCFDDAWYC